MASEIRVNKITHTAGVGTITPSPTGVHISGIVTGTTFSGSGASLTSLPAAQVTGTLPAISGANLTNLTAGNLTGTIADARFPATLPAASAANLTSIPAANVTGTLPALTAANLTNIPAANLVGVCTSGLTKTGGFGSTGWTHVDYTSIGTGGSYTFSGIPTDTTAFRILFRDLSSDTGSNGSESYTGFRLGTASGLITTYVAVVAYLEDSYQNVDAWTSRHMLYNLNYGRAEHVYTGQIQCWKTAGTNSWNIMSDVNRGSGNATYYWGQGHCDLGGSITQASFFLNTGSFDGGSAAISYYQD